MSDPPGGYLVVRRDVHPSQPIAGGDLVDIYPVLETVEEFVAGREANHTVTTATTDTYYSGSIMLPAPLPDGESGPRGFARAAAVTFEAARPRPRVQRQRGCDCSKRGERSPLVVTYAFSGWTWVWVRGNRLPTAAKRQTAHLYEANTAWPVPLLEPEPQVTCCRVCGSYWAVFIDKAGYRLVRLGTPAFGVSVAQS